MDWIPIVFVAFKFVVLATGMFFAIKWHYDQGKKGKRQAKAEEKRAVLRASAIVAVVFVLGLLGVGFLTFELIKLLGM